MIARAIKPPLEQAPNQEEGAERQFGMNNISSVPSFSRRKVNYSFCRQRFMNGRVKLRSTDLEPSKPGNDVEEFGNDTKKPAEDIYEKKPC